MTNPREIGMLSWIAERTIRTAMERGACEHLKGKGSPLILEEEGEIPKEWRTAFWILKNAGLTPVWVTLDKEVREKTQRLRADYVRLAVKLEGNIRNPDWRQLSCQMDEVYASIMGLNLKVPHPTFQRALLRCRDEMERSLAEQRRETGLDDR
jgi:hypothetical protein